jgi:hypothetical protein
MPWPILRRSIISTARPTRISGKLSGVTMIPRVDIEARFVDALAGDTEEDVEWSHFRSPDVHSY